MTIVEAVQTVLKDADKPMHINEIYELIIQRNLYVFGAKDPKSVMSQTIRKKSDANPKAKDIMFRLISQGTYELSN